MRITPAVGAARSACTRARISEAEVAWWRLEPTPCPRGQRREGARDVVEERGGSNRVQDTRDVRCCVWNLRDLNSDRARPTHEAFGSYCPEVSLSDQARAGLRACEHAPMARPTLHGFPIWSPKSVPSLWISFSHTAAGQPRNHTGFPFKCSRLEPGAHQHDGDTRFHVHRLSTLDTGGERDQGTPCVLAWSRSIKLTFFF